MVKSAETINLLVNKWKDMTVFDLTTFANTQNMELAKKILDKYRDPRFPLKKQIEIASVKGQQRRAKQYIRMITEPNFKEIQHIKAKYKIELDRTDYAQNFIRMGNTEKGGGVVDEYPRTIEEILSLNRMGTISEITKKDGSGKMIRAKMGGTAIEYMDFLHVIRLNEEQRQILKFEGISEFQVKIKIKMKEGDEKWISTPKMMINEFAYDAIEEFMELSKSAIDRGDPYEMEKEIFGVKKQVLEHFKQLLAIEVIWWEY